MGSSLARKIRRASGGVTQADFKAFVAWVEHQLTRLQEQINDLKHGETRSEGGVILPR